LITRFVAFDVGEAADPMPLQTAMQRGAPQMRDRRLQRVKTIVERQQRVLAKGDDDRFFVRGQDVEQGAFGPIAASAVVVRRFHFATVFGLIP
jgi:hypothetical protein